MAFRTNKVPVLQEKSASGAVATFNTALAMPLSSCNIAVNAWQEGSGDPSPSNVRPIHGFSVVNATRAGKNLCNINDITHTGVFNDQGYVATAANRLYTGFIRADSVQNMTISIVGSKDNEPIFANRVIEYGINKKFLRRIIPGSSVSTFVYTPSSDCFYIVVDLRTWSLLNIEISDLMSIQVEAGSTATAYEPYVTPTIYTIQLGQEVYGADIDFKTGVATVTHQYYIPPLRDWGRQDSNIFYTVVKQELVFGEWEPCICNKAKTRKSNESGTNRGICYVNAGGRIIFTTVDSYSSATEMYNAVGGNIEFVCILAEPFDIQLTPTQIETIRGNNTIFADTGDIDLTYKDLDIAKRGNFREVFKLPS